MGTGIISMLPGLTFTAVGNPSLVVVKLHGIKRLAHIDRSTGIVDVYKVDLKGRKINEMGLAEFQKKAEVERALPVHNGITLASVKGSVVKLHPQLWTMSRVDIKGALIAIFEYCTELSQFMGGGELEMQCVTFETTKEELEHTKLLVKKLAAFYTLDVEFVY